MENYFAAIQNKTNTLKKILPIIENICNIIENDHEYVNVEYWGYKLDKYIKELIKHTEKLSLLVRQIGVYIRDEETVNQINDFILDNIPYILKYTKEGWIYFKFFSLLPTKKKSKKYLQDTLMRIFSDFYKGRAFDSFDNCDVCISFIYPDTLPSCKWNDYDNIETSNLLNVVNTFCLADDSSNRINLHYFAKTEDSLATELIIMPHSDFEKNIKLFNEKKLETKLIFA